MVNTPAPSNIMLKEAATPGSRTGLPSRSSSTQISPVIGAAPSFHTPIEISRTAARFGARPRSASTTAYVESADHIMIGGSPGARGASESSSSACRRKSSHVPKSMTTSGSQSAGVSPARVGGLSCVL